MLGANHIPPVLSDRVVGSWLWVIQHRISISESVSFPGHLWNQRCWTGFPGNMLWVKNCMQKVYWGVLLGNTSERQGKERVGLRLKLIHSTIVTYSTESSRTRTDLETCQKLRQGGQAFVPPHLLLLVRGHWGKVITLGEACPGDRHLWSVTHQHTQQQDALALGKRPKQSATVSTTYY